MACQGSYFLMRKFPVRSTELMSHASRQSLKLSEDVMYQHSEARYLVCMEAQRVQNDMHSYTSACPCVTPSPSF